MKNIEKYKDEILNAYHADLSCCVHSDILHLPCNSNCIECKKSVVEWLLEEYKEPILDDVEKEYLSAVIKPFRKKVMYISKQKSFNTRMEYLHIVLFNGDFMYLPNFEENTMYKGMEVCKCYKPEELGL